MIRSSYISTLSSRIRKTTPTFRSKKHHIPGTPKKNTGMSPWTGNQISKGKKKTSFKHHISSLENQHTKGFIQWISIQFQVDRSGGFWNILTVVKGSMAIATPTSLGLSWPLAEPFFGSCAIYLPGGILKGHQIFFGNVKEAVPTWCYSKSNVAHSLRKWS